MIDTYGMNDKQARCSKCGKFMPWANSVQVEVDTGELYGAPALVEKGVCDRHKEEQTP